MPGVQASGTRVSTVRRCSRCLHGNQILISKVMCCYATIWRRPTFDQLLLPCMPLQNLAGTAVTSRRRCIYRQLPHHMHQLVMPHCHDGHMGTALQAWSTSQPIKSASKGADCPSGYPWMGHHPHQPLAVYWMRGAEGMDAVSANPVNFMDIQGAGDSSSLEPGVRGSHCSSSSRTKGAKMAGTLRLMYASRYVPGCCRFQASKFRFTAPSVANSASASANTAREASRISRFLDAR